METENAQWSQLASINSNLMQKEGNYYSEWMEIAFTAIFQALQ